MKIYQLLLIILFSQACLVKKLVVTNADYAIESQIEKRTHLYSAQKDRLSVDVDRLLNESKAVVKPVIPFLESLHLDLPQIDQNYAYLKDTYLKLSASYTKLLAQNMAILDQKQQSEFFKTFDQSTKEYEERSSAERLERLEDRMEMFFGDVLPAQKKILEELNKVQMSEASLRKQNRNQLRLDLENAYKTGANSETFFELYQDYHSTLLNHERNLDLLKKLIPTLTKAQKKHFQEQLKEYKELVEVFLAKKF